MAEDELPDAWRPQRQHLGAAIERAAARQGGVLTREELRALGLDDRAISRRAEAGLLFRRFRGVYAVGRRDLPPLGEWRAALSAVGDDAALSHRACAEALGLCAGLTKPIHVTTPRRGLRRRGGLVLHSAGLPGGEVAAHRGLRITTVPRLLLDTAATEGTAAVMELCTAAAARGLFRRSAIEAVLDGRPGTVRLRAVLAMLDVGGGHTRRELEHRFRRLIVRHGIRPPAFNPRLRAPAGGVVIPDAAWLDVGFVVELDSRTYHEHEPGRFRDREKDLVYAELGLSCLRLTWRQVVHEEHRTAAALLRRVGPR